MKKLFLYCLSVCFALCSANAQLTATAVTNQNIRTVLENNFLGEGVKLDTTHNIYYNGQTVINNNQIGTFVNTDTSDGHIPIAAGIVLGTDAAVNLNSGSSVSRTNALTGASTNSPMLYLAYSRFVNDPDLNQYGNTLADNDFRDVAVLDFGLYLLLVRCLSSILLLLQSILLMFAQDLMISLVCLLMVLLQ